MYEQTHAVHWTQEYDQQECLYYAYMKMN